MLVGNAPFLKGDSGGSPSYKKVQKEAFWVMQILLVDVSLGVCSTIQSMGLLSLKFLWEQLSKYCSKVGSPSRGDRRWTVVLALEISPAWEAR